jgi:hypothetical protein
LPVSVLGAQTLQARVAALDGREPVGLVNGHGPQPAEDRVAVGLAAEEDDPGGLAGVFDQLVWRPDDVGDSSVQFAVVPA